MWHWYWSQWHNVTQTPMAAYDSNASGYCVTWPESHVTSNFECFDLKNIFVTLRILIASNDANPSANGMTWQEKSCCTSLLSSWPKECNDATGMKWHWYWYWMALHDQNSYVVPHFDDVDTRNVMVLLTMPSTSCDAGPLILHDQKVMLHFILIILT